MIPRDRVLEKLDSLLRGNDYNGAKRLLEYWLSEAEVTGDRQGALLMQNELMGLCRKLSLRESALKYAEDAQSSVQKMGIEDNVGAATTYLNSATVYKAFSMPEKSISLFCKARDIYESSLSDNDERLAGLYNNMALTLVDLSRFDEANALYNKALGVLEGNPDKEPERAITYLNMATAAETEFGLILAQEKIKELCEKAMDCLETSRERIDGNYAFVCEKCASVFEYYGFAEYASELKKRYGRIYEGA